MFELLAVLIGIWLLLAVGSAIVYIAIRVIWAIVGPSEPADYDRTYRRRRSDYR